MNNFHRGPGIDASYHVSVHLAKRFQRRIFFLNRPISNKNCMWWPCVLTNQDRMNTFYSRSYIDASYEDMVYLDQSVSEERIFKKSATQKEELPMAAMVITGSGQNVQSL